MPSVSKSKRKKVYSKTNGNCIYCDTNLIKSEGNPYHDDVFNVDHINPKSNGGSLSKIENLVPSCRKCNCSKGPHTPFQWKEIIDKKISQMEREISWMRTVSKNINLRFLKKNG